MSAGKPPRRKHPLTIAEVRALDRGEVLPSADRRYGTPTGRSARSNSPTPYRAVSPTPYRAPSPNPYRSASPDPYYRQAAEDVDWAAYNEFAQREAALGRHVPDFTTFRQVYGTAPVSAPVEVDAAPAKEHKESFFQRIFKGKEKRGDEGIAASSPARPPPVPFTPRSTTPTPSQRYSSHGESPSHRNYEPPRAARDSVKPEAYYGRASSPLPPGFTPLNQQGYAPAPQLPPFEPVQYAPQQPVYTYMESPRAPIQPQFTPLQHSNFVYSEPVSYHQEMPPVVMPAAPQIPIQQELQLPLHMAQQFQQEIHLQSQFQQIPMPQPMPQMPQQIPQMPQQIPQQMFPMVYPQGLVEQQQMLQQPIVVDNTPQLNFADFSAQVQQQQLYLNGPNIQQSAYLQPANTTIEYMLPNPQVQIIPEFMATGAAYGAPVVAAPSGHHLAPGTPISTPRSATPTNPPIAFDPVSGMPFITNLGGSAQFVFDTNAARAAGHGMTSFSVRQGAPETGSLRTQSSNNSWKGSQQGEQPQAGGEDYRRYRTDRESPANGLYQDPKDENEKLREEAARAVERVEELQEQLARANGEIERLRHREQSGQALPVTQRPPTSVSSTGYGATSAITSTTTRSYHVVETRDSLLVGTLDARVTSPDKAVEEPRQTPPQAVTLLSAGIDADGDEARQSPPQPATGYQANLAGRQPSDAERLPAAPTRIPVHVASESSPSYNSSTGSTASGASPHHSQNYIAPPRQTIAPSATQPQEPVASSASQASSDAGDDTGRLHRPDGLRPTLGVEIKMIDDALGNKDSVVAIHDVIHGSPAHLAGLHSNDIIERWDGRQLDSKGAFEDCIRRSVIGSVVTLDIVRGGHSQQFFVTVGGTARTAPRRARSNSDLIHEG